MQIFFLSSSPSSIPAYPPTCLPTCTYFFFSPTALPQFFPQVSPKGRDRCAARTSRTLVPDLAEPNATAPSWPISTGPSSLFSVKVSHNHTTTSPS